MVQHARFLGWMVVFATCFGGCPLLLQPEGGGSTPAAATGGSGNTGSAGGTQDAQLAGTDLAAQFPDCGEPAEGEAWRARILELVNQERVQAGLAALAHNAVLEAQATQYACEMIHYEYFSHINPFTGTELEDRTAEFGYVYVWIGENLAAGQPTPEEAFDGWMNSEGHRDNILHPGFTELGVGVRTGGDYGIYWVQEFGTPRP
ncbi:MAG TPA: CAP domain-containing protein [Phycisphaerae bacterium]|nr:CAP domain-containing protein [Phycisphaerae bacterium]